MKYFSARYWKARYWNPRYWNGTAGDTPNIAHIGAAIVLENGPRAVQRIKFGAAASEMTGIGPRVVKAGRS